LKDLDDLDDDLGSYPDKNKKTSDDKEDYSNPVMNSSKEGGGLLA